MHIEELVTKIQPLSKEIIRAAQKRFDNLIKPVGSLAQLESMTARYAGIIGSSDKQLVTVPETRLLLLWGEAKHAAQIEEDGLAFLDRLQCPVVAAMTGAILQAAGMRIPVMLDGVATCLAALAASMFNPFVLQYCFAGDESAEAGSGLLLDKLKLQAPLRLSLNHSEGVGALTCLRLFDAGIKAYTEMETFEEAGVHNEKEDYSLKVQEEKKNSKEDAE